MPRPIRRIKTRKLPAPTPAKIKARRTSAGLTQVELADLVRKHPMTVSAWERGIQEIDEGTWEYLIFKTEPFVQLERRKALSQGEG